MSTISTRKIIPNSFNTQNVTPKGISSKEFTGTLDHVANPKWGEVIWGNFKYGLIDVYSSVGQFFRSLDTKEIK